MKIYTDLKDYIKHKNTVVTVGTFDGLHKGHKQILKVLIDKAVSIDGSSVMITFEPHPRTVVSKDFNLKLLTTLEEKIELLQECGLDNLIIINFTKEFSQLTSEQFIKNLIIDKIGAVHMVIGHDHKFGKDRLGDEEKLREIAENNNFEVTSVKAEMFEGGIISSTLIRNSLVSGDIETVNNLLGRNYTLRGNVVKGAQRGRLLGFPTANLKLTDDRKAVPKRGVYIVECKCEGEQLFGIMNIGLRPTFGDTLELVIEVHLLNFNRDIYDADLVIDFKKRLRDEKKFESKEELIHQIEEDKIKALEFINSFNN